MNGTNISSGVNVENPLQFFELTLQPSEVSQPFYFNYDYFRMLDLSGDGVKVRFAASGTDAEFTSAGIGFKCPLILPFLQFRNDGVNPVTFRFAVAIGDITDDRLNVSGNIAVVNAAGTSLATKDVQSTVFDTAQVALVAATAASILAANASRKAAVITAGNTDLFIGNSIAVDNTTGFKIAAGQSFTIGHGLEIFGYNVAGDTIFTYEEEY